MKMQFLTSDLEESAAWLAKDFLGKKKGGVIICTLVKSPRVDRYQLF